MRALGGAIDGNHIETQPKSTPFTVGLQKVASGSNDFALLAPVHRLERSAEIALGALTDFDDKKQLVFTGDNVQFAGAATQVARQHFNASQLQMADGERFAVQPASHAWVGHGGSMRVAVLARAG
jgi:hypothetical protein